MSKKARWILIAVGVIAISIILLAVSIELTSQATFCRSCHEMIPEVDGWAKSSHSEVGCEECHIRPGIINTLVAKARSLGEVYAHVANSYTLPINKGGELSKTFDFPCTTCHTKMFESFKVPIEVSIKFPHNKHAKYNINCARCHNRVAHPNVKGHRSNITMVYCVDCHEKDKVTVECSACHSKAVGLKPASHKDLTNWILVHGKQVSAECTMCHRNKASFCDKCHGLPMPHQVNWKNDLHGKNSVQQNFCEHCHSNPIFCESCHHKGYNPATQRWTKIHPQVVKVKGQKTCMGCHTQAYCDNCHKTKNPHTANWLQTHYSAAQTGCFTCHPKAFCNDCHFKKNPHPANWISVHPPQAAARCFTCHSKAWCSDCHSKKNPHPSNWLGSHASTAEKIGQNVCMKCHKQSFCTNCHTTKNPHPSNWPKIHPKQASNKCYTCHSTSFCINCHKRTNPHPSGWIEKHEEAANSSCYNCHQISFCRNCHARSGD